jgi:hypothetical protein
MGICVPRQFQRYSSPNQYGANKMIFHKLLPIGATVDTSVTKFYSGTELGMLDASLTVLPSPYLVGEPEGTDFSATPVSMNANNTYMEGDRKHELCGALVADRDRRKIPD